MTITSLRASRGYFAKCKCISRILRRGYHGYATGNILTKSSDIREGFLNYFEKNGHEKFSSSSLVPESDPTLLFTSAGMVPFKPYFLGEVEPKFKRVCSSQRCVRAGGKHNDLDNVGFTPRHHTFFEMLGNFSFGDYFKEEAIVYAWDFVTKELQIPVNDLRITIFKDDDESELLWSKLAPGVPIVRMGKEDNFWSMGDGPGVPCGPCTEIFFDQGGDKVGNDDDRWLEIWNLVFMQYQFDGQGGLQSLPRPCVDTGMDNSTYIYNKLGLERIASVMQGVSTNFETDLLHPLVQKTGEICSQRSNQTIIIDRRMLEFSKRVIADHIRASAFLIADGVVPSNVGRGYVLRRIIRRALGFGHKIGIREPFMSELLDTLETTMGDTCPDLVSKRKGIASVLSGEEEIFARTLDRGIELLHAHIRNRNLDSEAVFQLYDTYGFPVDLTASIASESKITIDLAAVEQLMEEQRKRSGAGLSWKYEGGSTELPPDHVGSQCEFTGYTNLVEQQALVTKADKLPNGYSWITIDPCPFYAEGGGQVGDKGILMHSTTAETVKIENSVRSSSGGISLLACGQPVAGDLYVARVDENLRKGCSIHHTATHLLNAGLKKILNENVLQAGSYVTHDRLRFDFTHPRALTDSEIREVEDYVNDIILSNLPVVTKTMHIDEAKKLNAAMLFGEKYDDIVRVVMVENSGSTKAESIELCGGTHIESTLHAYPFKIVTESSAAAGTRRIEGVAGKSALTWLESQKKTLDQLSEMLKVPPTETLSQVSKLRSRIKQLEKDLLAVRTQSIDSTGPVMVSLGNVCVHTIQDNRDDDKKVTNKIIQTFANNEREKHPNSWHVIICGSLVVCTVEPNSALLCEGRNRPHAGKVLKQLLCEFGGKGGGNDRFAQGKVEVDSINPQLVAEKMQHIIQ